ncbi:MAG: hypothetical protein HUU57_10310 [Bdellovibrio sp.]|nr:hypothetical protein [Bdellovibrio sp.]
MPELKAFIRSEARAVVKRLRENAGYIPEVRLRGYVFKDLEERAEQIPLSDLVPILLQIDDGTLHSWWFDFNLKIYELKQNQKKEFFE